MTEAMQFAELSQVKHRVQPGAPLPFNVRDADKSLLLARGQVVESRAHLETLFSRGALVDLAEILSSEPRSRPDLKSVPREQLPRLWNQALSKVSLLLMEDPDGDFNETLNDAAGPVQDLIKHDPNLAIFQILQKSDNADQHYGAQRSVQAAITSMLVALRLGWDESQAERAFKVALTMNLSMLQLQGQLARQLSPPTAQQRKDLHSHPERSVHMLELAGVTDTDWLQAVAQHHETEDGSGYPKGCTGVSELASLVHRADVYTAKLAPRSSRPALPPDLASRQMFMQDPGHNTTTALVKEFGIYPPGCFVRLQSGEVGVVVGRGPTITTPVVACLTNERGAQLQAPVRVNTAERGRAVHRIVAASALPMKVTSEKLLLMAAVP